MILHVQNSLRNRIFELIITDISYKNLYRSVVITIFLTCVCSPYGKNQDIAAQPSQDALQQVAAFNFGRANAIVSGSNRFYMSSGRAVRMFDAENPGQLTEKEHIILPEIVRALSLSEHILAAALQNEKIQLIEVSGFDQFELIKMIDNLPAVSDVLIMNELLVIAVGSDGAWVFDISSPEAPVKMSEIPVESEGDVIRELIGLNHDHLVIAGDQGWHIYDLSNAASPELIAAGSRNYPVRSLAAEESTLFVAFQSQNGTPQGRVGIYDISDLSSPALITDLEFNFPMSQAYLAVNNGKLILNSANSFVIDVSNPEVPETIIQRPSIGQNIVFNNNHFYTIADGRRKVRVWELIDQNEINNVQTVSSGDSYNFIEIREDRIFLSNRYLTQSLVADLHFSHTDHKLIQTNGVLMPAMRVFASDNLLYTGANGFLVDISDPQNYRFLGPVPSHHLMNPVDRMDAVWVSDDLLLSLVNGTHKSERAGLELFDVSDPENPQLLDFYETPTFGNYRAVVWDTLVFHIETSGINLFNLNSNKKLEHLSRLKKTWLRSTADIRNNHLYVVQSTRVGYAELVDSLMAVDFSNPHNPVFVQQMPLEQRVASLKVYDEFLFMMTSGHELQVYSLENPSRPEFMYSYEIEDTFHSFAIDDNGFLFTTHGDVGLKIWKIPDVTLTESTPVISEVPEKFILGQNYPNPFNPVTVIEYELPVDSEVVLEVFDIIGRRVVVLVNERRTAGVHQASWDATNAASGVYIYRISAGDFVQSRSMMLVK